MNLFTTITNSTIWGGAYFGNTVEQYAIAALVFAALTVAFQIFQLILLSRLDSFAKRTKSDIDDVAIKIVRSIKPPIYLGIALLVAFNTLNLSSFIQEATTVAIITLVVYQVIIALQIFIDYILSKRFVKGDSEETDFALKTIGNTIKVALWVIGFLLILQNMGVEVTSLIAGLGIGGVAVALAAQNILGDLFSSFAIVFDKPFEPGDFIVVGEHMGTVEKVGIKTTRIRALQGEEIVISNQELTSTRIQNFKKMQKRRIVFTLGITYETRQSLVEKVPDFIEKAIRSQKKTEFDRAHFREFGDSALIFEVVYFVTSGDYNDYMDTQQNINLEIMKTFEKEKISMAYPTQTLFLKK